MIFMSNDLAVLRELKIAEIVFEGRKRKSSRFGIIFLCHAWLYII